MGLLEGSYYAKIAFLCLIFALLLHLISFGAPNWAQTNLDVVSRSDHYGLWRYCTDPKGGGSDCSDFIDTTSSGKLYNSGIGIHGIGGSHRVGSWNSFVFFNFSQFRLMAYDQDYQILFSFNMSNNSNIIKISMKYAVSSLQLRVRYPQLSVNLIG